MHDAYEKIFSNKNKILVVFAHPDDLEISCGGTVARLIQDGKTVRSVKVSSGNMGSRQEEISSPDLKSVRETEDREAMNILGIKNEDSVFLGLNDGSIENNLELVGLLAYQIRLFKPDLIITHNPEDMIIRFEKNVNWVNHRDHRNTGKSTIDAAYPYSRDILFFPEHFRDGNVTSHTTTEFLLIDYYDHPDLVAINVDKHHELRTKAIAAHASQYSLENAQESTDFFTKKENGRFETFRYVVAD